MQAHPDTFKLLVTEYLKNERDECSDAIDQDLLRTFPENRHFKTTMETIDAEHMELYPVAMERMRRILTVYARYQPAIGYCQSMNYIVALLIVFIPDDEKVFWLLETLLATLLPTDMYAADSSLLGAKVDQEVLWELIRIKFPDIWRKAVKQHSCPFDAPPACAITTPWFLKLFIDVLPTETLLRLWDCLFYEGNKVLFRAALTIFKFHEKMLLACDSALDVYTVLRVSVVFHTCLCSWL
jgi:hypothetical protein